MHAHDFVWVRLLPVAFRLLCVGASWRRSRTRAGDGSRRRLKDQRSGYTLTLRNAPSRHVAGAVRVAGQWPSGTTYALVRVPFSWHQALGLVQHLIAAVLSELPDTQVVIVQYLDDILFVGRDRQVSTRVARDTAAQLARKGFLVLSACQRCGKRVSEHLLDAAVLTEIKGSVDHRRADSLLRMWWAEAHRWALDRPAVSPDDEALLHDTLHHLATHDLPDEAPVPAAWRWRRGHH